VHAGTELATFPAVNHSSRNWEKEKMKIKNLALILLGALFAFSTLTGCPAADDDDSAGGDDDSAM
jgi:hypothetical protein